MLLVPWLVVRDLFPAPVAESLGSAVGSLAAALAVLGSVGMYGGRTSTQSVTETVSVTTLILGALVGLVVAARRCREWPGTGRLLASFLAWVLVVQVCLLLLVLGVQFSWLSMPLEESLMLVSQALLLGSVLGVVSFVTSAPFLLLAERSELFRRRFLQCLHPARANAPSAGPL